jgi:4'-phosphopantetheinyl transferase
VEPLVFSAAIPAAVARSLDEATIHLWRFRYARHEGRAPFIALLAAYAGLHPSGVTLVDAEGGKPYFSEATLGRMRTAEARTLRFNWSHSGDYALIALAYGQPLGVDIEHVRARLRALELARRFFDPAEADALAALDVARVGTAFIALWCAKEAVLKAGGRGLAFGLERVAFLPAAGGLAWRPHRIDAALGGAQGWSLTQFAPTPRYRGALAWYGPARAVRAFQLDRA